MYLVTERDDHGRIIRIIGELFSTFDAAASAIDRLPEVDRRIYMVEPAADVLPSMKH